MKIRYLIQSAILCSAWLVSGLAFAGNTQGGQGGGPEIGDLTHSPTLQAIGVPVLGGAGLLLLAILLGLFGFRVLRSDHGAGSKWLLAACLTTALASGTSGIKLMNDAYAIAMVSFQNEDGETVTLFAGDVEFLNGGGECELVNGGENGGIGGFVPVINGTETTQFLTDVSIAGGPCQIRQIERVLPEANAGNGGFLGFCEDLPLEMMPEDSCNILVCCEPI